MTRIFAALFCIAAAWPLSGHAATLVAGPVVPLWHTFTIDTPIIVEDSSAELDSLLDSLAFVFDLHGLSHRRLHRPHFFVLNEVQRTQQVPYREDFGLLDFNRVTGFFLGL